MNNEIVGLFKKKEKVIKIFNYILISFFIFFILLNVLTVFFYPLEIELRESTSWLHVLTLKAGINIYDHSQVAYLNMNHGPIDSIFKYLLSIVFPFLKSFQITRIAVLLLPFMIMVSSWGIIGKFAKNRAIDSIAISSCIYIILLRHSNGTFLLVGRSDVTSHLLKFALLLIMTLLMFREKTVKKTIILFYGLLIGIFFALTFFTNSRTIPFLLLVMLFLLLYLKLKNNYISKELLVLALSITAGFLLIATSLLYFLFHFDFKLYFNHFFGFFLKSSGSEGGPSPDFLTYIKGIMGLESNLILLFIIFIFLILFYLFFKNIIKKKDKILFLSWVFINILLLMTLAIAFYLNQLGGTLMYFDDFFIYSYFGFCLFYRKLYHNFKESFSTYFIFLLILFLLASTPWFNIAKVPLKMLKTLKPAYSFYDLEKKLDDNYTVLSEDIYFYKNKYKNEKIDMGETVYLVTKTEYFGKEFNDTAQKYFNNLEISKPDYIICIGYINSEYLNELIQSDYELISTGPDSLYANNISAGPKIFKRK